MITKGTVLSLALLITLYPTVEAKAIEFNKRVFKNGLTLVHVERESIPAVMVSLIIDASPLDEAADMAGLAHLTAKMLTEGTKTMNAKELSDAIDFVGASISTTVNHDYTQLSMTVLKKDINKMMHLFSDILLNPAFDEREIQRKREQIKGNLRQREEDPSFLSDRDFKRLLFGSHHYGRLVEGSQDALVRITAEDVRQFYSRFYVPEGAILAVVGDLTLREAEALVESYLLIWESKGLQNHQRQIKPPVIKPQMRTSIIDRDITQANIVFGHLGLERSNPDFYAVSVMNYILGGGGFASRLMKVVRDDLGLTYGISSHFSTNRYPGVFQVEVQTKNESAAQVVEEIKRQIAKMHNELVTEEELKDAKSFLIGSFPRRLETNRKIADLLAVSQFYNLGDDYLKRYPEYIGSVTREDILRVAKKYLNADKYTLVITGKKDLIRLSEAR